MKNKKQGILFSGLLILAIFLHSCSITKRYHNPGFHLESAFKNKAKENFKTTNIYPDTSANSKTPFTVIQKMQELKPELIMYQDTSIIKENQIEHPASVFPDLAEETEAYDSIQPESEVKDIQPEKKSKRHRSLRASVKTFILALAGLYVFFWVMNTSGGYIVAFVGFFLLSYVILLGIISLFLFFNWLKSESKRKREMEG